MHYEIFKYINSKDLIEIRVIKQGGYELISNQILRSRIGNYLQNTHFNLSQNIKDIRMINLYCEQTMGYLKIDGRIIEIDDIIQFMNILDQIRVIKGLIFGTSYSYSI